MPVRKLRPEAPEMGKMVDRCVRSLVRRAGDGDLEALEELARLNVAMSASLSAGIADAKAFGYSWTELAQCLGVTRRAVAKRAESVVVS